MNDLSNSASQIEIALKIKCSLDIGKGILFYPRNLLDLEPPIKNFYSWEIRKIFEIKFPHCANFSGSGDHLD